MNKLAKIDKTKERKKKRKKKRKERKKENGRQITLWKDQKPGNGAVLRKTKSR